MLEFLSRSGIECSNVGTHPIGWIRFISSACLPFVFELCRIYPPTFIMNIVVFAGYDEDILQGSGDELSRGHPQPDESKSYVVAYRKGIRKINR